jgi:hypothetical protein
MKLDRKSGLRGKFSQLVVLALLVSLTLSACQWPWEGPTPAGAVPSETSLTSVGGRIEVDGAQVQAEGGTAPEGTWLKGAFQEGELPTGLGDAYEAASKPLRIQLGEGLQPQKPLTVTIPVDTTKLDGFDPSTPALALLIITDGQEKPDIVKATWNRAAGTLTAQVPHLSLVQALFFNVDKWIKGVEATVLQSTGIEYPKPACVDQPATIATDTYSAGSAWAEWTCLSSAGNSLVVSAHSNSPIPFMVKSAPTVPGQVTTDFSRSGTITTALANQLGYTGSSGEAVMFPGGSVEFEFDKPAAGVSLSFHELPTVLLLSVLTQALDQAFDKFGQKLHLDALSKLECWKNILDTSLNPQLNAETASRVVKSVLACVGEIAELTVVGEVIILLVSAAPAAFAGMFLGAATSITGQANFNVDVKKSSQLKTFTDREMGISFQYPAGWSVTTPTDPRIKTGAKVVGPSGEQIASANFNTAFDFQPCAVQKPYQLLDSTPVNIPGMDTSAAQTTIKTELVDVGVESMYYSDKKPLRLGIALYSGPGQSLGTTEVCNLGAFFQSGGKYGFFSADRGLNNAREATTYMTTQEYQEVKAMLASLRFL